MNPIDLRPRVVSPPGAFVRVTERPDGTRLYVAPPPDGIARMARAFGQFTRALGLAVLPGIQSAMRAAAEFDRVLAQTQAAMRVPQRLRDEANALPRVAGLEARYYVRAALDPAFTTPEALSWLVGRLLAGDNSYDTDLWLVTPENRILIAVSAMRGWEQRGERLTSWWCGDVCQEGEAVGMQASCSPVVRWRCEHYNPAEPPLIAHRAWPLTRLEVRCG